MRIALAHLMPALLAMSAAPYLFAQRLEPPSGWSVSQDGAKQVYRPDGLPTTESFTVTLEPTSRLGEGGLQQWFIRRVKADAESRGPFDETVPLQQGPLGTYYLERVYRGNNKRVWDVVYVGFPLAEHRSLFCLMASNLPNSPEFHEYVRVGGKICGRVAKTIEESSAGVK
jgi:hypothetical protein